MISTGSSLALNIQVMGQHWSKKIFEWFFLLPIWAQVLISVLIMFHILGVLFYFTGYRLRKKGLAIIFILIAGFLLYGNAKHQVKEIYNVVSDKITEIIKM